MLMMLSLSDGRLKAKARGEDERSPREGAARLCLIAESLEIDQDKKPHPAVWTKKGANIGPPALLAVKLNDGSATDFDERRDEGK